MGREIASRAGIQVACSIDHVEELVIHWMTRADWIIRLRELPWEPQPGATLRRAARRIDIQRRTPNR